MKPRSDFTKGEWKRLIRYVQQLRHLLELKDWYLEVMHATTGDDGDHDAEAKIHPTEGQPHARLWLSGRFLDLTPEDQRHVLVHELLHLHHRDATDIIRLVVPEALGQLGNALLWEPFRQHVELMTDRIARAIAPLLPLPTIRKQKEGGA